MALFAFAGAALALDPLVRRLTGGAWGKGLTVGGLTALLAFGLWDQTSPKMVPDYLALAANYASDAAFVGELEHDLTPGAMVFQVPYIAFPEAVSFGRCKGYDHLRPYLVSHSLRWSFGAFRGRPADALVHLLSELQPEEMLRVLVLIGFDGLMIDRFGYADEAAQFEKSIDALLSRSPKISSDGRWAFYGLGEFKAKLKTQIPESQWQQASKDLARPILPIFGTGFLPEEGPPDDIFRWGGANSELRLVNSEGLGRMVEIEFAADRLSLEPVHLEVNYPSGKSNLLIGYGQQRFHMRLKAEPGFTVLRFVCDGKPVTNTINSRELVFRLKRFTVLPESVP